jgi:acyl-coenzyme A synthetase/AMP-(fatty) acid ligase
MKPGSTGPAIPGIHPVIYDEEGKELPSGSGKAGNICIRNPWLGAFQTIWKDPDRYVRKYSSRYWIPRARTGETGLTWRVMVQWRRLTVTTGSSGARD